VQQLVIKELQFDYLLLPIHSNRWVMYPQVEDGDGHEL
jgi:hypothetical protein